LANIKNNNEMNLQNSSDEEIPNDSGNRFKEDGFVILENLCSDGLLKQLLKVSRHRLQEVHKALENKDIGIGSANGYLEICQRSPGRWDAPITPRDFGIDLKKLPWLPFISVLLEGKVEFNMSGIISSEPNTTTPQEWHIDSPHVAREHLPVHALHVLIALVDIPLEMGPTEFARASHVLTNHLSTTSLTSNEMVYQHEGTSPESLVNGTEHPIPKRVKSDISAGSCVVFDERVLHRGSANITDQHRHVAYFAYNKKGYQADTYFENNRSIFEDY
jgi:hypothetical protein